MVANPELVKRMKISPDRVTKINILHMLVDEELRDMKSRKPTSTEFKYSLNEWRKLQMELQLSWGFKVDQGKWCEYRLPHCTCPKMDNDDMGYHMYFSADCPIHRDTKFLEEI